DRRTYPRARDLAPAPFHLLRSAVRSMQPGQAPPQPGIAWHAPQPHLQVRLLPPVVAEPLPGRERLARGGRPASPLVELAERQVRLTVPRVQRQTGVQETDRCFVPVFLNFQKGQIVPHLSVLRRPRGSPLQ